MIENEVKILITYSNYKCVNSRRFSAFFWISFIIIEKLVWSGKHADVFEVMPSDIKSQTKQNKVEYVIHTSLSFFMIIFRDCLCSFFIFFVLKQSKLFKFIS